MPSKQSNVSLFITGNDPELIPWFIEDALAVEEGPGRYAFKIGEQTLRAYCGEAFPIGVSASEMDGCICLIRFVDQAAMQLLLQRVKSISDQLHLPIYFLIYRKPNEQDFKMSCPFCGQKLWVRDVDLDKRGRCPSCKKGFTLPRQEDQVIHLLGLKRDAPVYRVMSGDSSSLAAPLRLFLKRKEERDALASAKQVFRENTETMNVNVE